MLTAFTWGYYGWGSASTYFVRAADELECERGYESPVFVDLRVHRNVKAANFNGRIFEKIVGPSRYEWMPRLGNQRILSKTGERIQIADPAAADDLLKSIIRLDSQQRRIIMFCSCREPLLKQEDGYPSCHRVTVVDLLFAAARKAGVVLDVAEWPGGEPTELRLAPDAVQLAALKNKSRFIPISPVAAPRSLPVMLAWGSIVEFKTAVDQWTIVTGPAYVRKGHWMWEVVNREPLMGTEALASAKEHRDAFLKSGYGRRRSIGLGN